MQNRIFIHRFLSVETFHNKGVTKGQNFIGHHEPGMSFKFYAELKLSVSKLCGHIMADWLKRRQFSIIQ